MYNINQHPDGYCLLYYVLDDIESHHPFYILAHQLIPYCLRTSEEHYDILEFNNAIDPTYTFVELREKNITSQQLLSWSASIELTEEYQMFLNNTSDLSFSNGNETRFHNCTQPWFGPHCQFTFAVLTERTLSEIVARKFRSIKPRVTNGSNVTCYIHLNCNTAWGCLDWREVCDRKVDCPDGLDELNCWQLEINECDQNEYRCYNGQCIPKEFFHDAALNSDCLDRTDEPLVNNQICSLDPAFRCEEHSCRPGEKEFPCGDGQCTAEMELTCTNSRGNILLNNICLTGMACLLKMNEQISIHGKTSSKWCDTFCKKYHCGEDNCSLFYDFPPTPILFGHVRFIFRREKQAISDFMIPIPFYVCYHKQICEDFLSDNIFYSNDTSCRSFFDIGSREKYRYIKWSIVLSDVKERFRGCSVVPNETHYCNHSTMYRCKNSTKCISKRRLVDGIRDCPYDDDETFNESCSLSDAHNRFACFVSDQKKCFAALIIEDRNINCANREDEPELEPEYTYKTGIVFHRICDGIEELLPMLIDGQNETDETNCEYWICNNTYTRCDGFWSCKNGADEINCEPSICSESEHMCIFPNDASKLACLPITRAGDGNVDCLGATDERSYCQVTDLFTFQYRFRCLNSTKCVPIYYLCDRENDCPSGDDETFCNKKLPTGYPFYLNDPLDLTEIDNFVCSFAVEKDRSQMTYYALRHMPIYPVRKLVDYVPSLSEFSKIENKLVENSLSVDTNDEQAWLCNRGLPIYIRINTTTSELHCLCPPSYYGDRCQYQNQRVSLSVQIRVVTNWHNKVTFIIMLIDDMQNIESHDYIEYLPVGDCNVKFNVYLLYSTRPKNSTKTYSVRIDAFNKLGLNYRSSWIYPIRFSFLPVYRLSVLLKVPFSNVEPLQKSTLPCVHGRRFNYVNDQHVTFCQCEPGWSGVHCHIEYTCNCAVNALCIGKAICLCPIGQFGPRCYLFKSLCHSDSCMNSGQCVVDDERYTSNGSTKFKCVCSEEYFGERCEHRQTRIDISFHKELSIPQSLLVHFISVQDDVEPIRTSTMKKIAFDQDSLLIYTSSVFNIAFAEMFGNYYLIILQEQNIISANITTQIIPSYRCASIHELFNKTLANQHLLKRTKYYHVPCQKQLHLVCFYDDIHFCLCDLDRRTNCFKFNHNMTYDCYGYNMCENEGHCFQNDPKCPTSSTCVCHDCYYGSRCQFSAKGSTLSLDAILGYGIRPYTSINQQSFTIKVAITLATIIFIFGLFSNLFSFMTFYSKKTCDVGCGLYLRTLSIVSIITISVFLIKFWLLVASQMGSIANRSFIYGQCVCVDFVLRLLVSSGDWLSACLAIERAVNISCGVTFNKAKSKQIAKWIISIVFVITSCTHIHDPIHRYLINDEGEQRTWCVVKYSSSWHTFDWAVNILHFSFPFGINCISAIVIITTTARLHSTVRKTQSYKQHLRIQFRQHKHLLISPCILVLLAIPRLIISFLSGCMKSARNPWLYLTGYFISFIPSMMTFIVFVLPSKMYKKEFTEMMKKVFLR